MLTISRPASALFLALSILPLAACTTSATDNASLGLAATDNASLGLAETDMPIGAMAPVPSLKPGADAAVMEAAAADETLAGQEDLAAAEPLTQTAMIAVTKPVAALTSAFGGGSRARECLMRAMYFESNRSSREGMLAVGTVVMNRVASGRFGSSVCGVVGAPRQFAPGVMSRRIQGDTNELSALADAILRGKRHPRLYAQVMHFHQSGLRFHYGNMRYVLNAGGNSFY